MAYDLKGRKLPPNITQRKNGLYCGRVAYNNERKAVYDRSLTELKKKMTDLRHSMEHGTYVKLENITFEDWFKEWIDTYKRNTVKAGTIESYNKHYNAYIKDSIGKIKLADIRPEHLQKLLNKMADNGYSDNTIELCYCVLSGAFKQAYKNELIIKNPFSRITRPRGEKAKERIAFTKEQQQLYMQYAEKSYLCNLLQLAVCTGMRNGELSGLLWSDVDFKNKIIHVRHTLIIKPGGGTALDTPKTRTSLRDIPMTGKAYDILKRQEKEYKEYHRGITKIVNDDFVFSVLDEPISKKRITFEIKSMLAKMEKDNIDFPYFTLHATRHTFATRCIEAGMEPQVLKTILGHATLSMTMDLYSHVLPDIKKEAMEAVASAF